MAALVAWRCRCGAQSQIADATEEAARARLRSHQLDSDCLNNVPDGSDVVAPVQGPEGEAQAEADSPTH